MPDARSYTIDKVGWHTRTPGNTEPREKTHRRFRAIIRFLQAHQLTRRVLLGEDGIVDDETAIHTDDLTENGRMIMEKCYHRWLKKVDRGADPEDISSFKRELDALSR